MFYLRVNSIAATAYTTKKDCIAKAARGHAHRPDAQIELWKDDCEGNPIFIQRLY